MDLCCCRLTGRGSLLAGRLHLGLVPSGRMCICTPVTDEGESTATVEEGVEGHTAADEDRRELSRLLLSELMLG